LKGWHFGRADHYWSEARPHEDTADSPNVELVGPDRDENDWRLFQTLLVVSLLGLEEDLGPLPEVGGHDLGLAWWLWVHRSDWELEGLDGIQKVLTTNDEQGEQIPGDAHEKGNPGNNSKKRIAGTGPAGG
jgi:hypothetical protein